MFKSWHITTIATFIIVFSFGKALAAQLPVILPSPSLPIAGASNESIKRAVKLAFKELNNPRVKPIFYQGDPKSPRSMTLAKKIIKVDRPFAIIGHPYNSSNRVTFPKFIKEKIPVISPIVRTRELGSKTRGAFFISGNQGWLEAYTAIAVHAKLHWKKVAIVSRDPSPGLVSSFYRRSVGVILDKRISRDGTLTNQDESDLLEKLSVNKGQGIIINLGWNGNVKLDWVRRLSNKTNLLFVIESQSLLISRTIGFDNTIYLLRPIGPDSYPRIQEKLQNARANNLLAFRYYIATKILLQAGAASEWRRGTIMTAMYERVFEVHDLRLRFNKSGMARWMPYSLYKIPPMGPKISLMSDGGSGDDCKCKNYRSCCCDCDGYDEDCCKDQNLCCN
jgi:hypothetical protein